MAQEPRSTRRSSSGSTPGSSRAPYLDSQSGWRTFVIGLLVAAIIGLGFRLYFSPQRLKGWALAALEQQKKKSNGHPFAVSFDRVDISLARGWIPEFALVLSNLKVAPRSDCRPDASIFAGHLRLPLRLRSLALGRAAIGVVTAEDLVVDLDGLRAPCETHAPETPPAERPAKTAKSAPSEQPKPPPEPAKPWWAHEQYENAEATVEGIEFSRATLQFENRTKEIYLDSFDALLRGGDKVSIQTEMRIPPSVAYGESIPPLRIDGEATSRGADLSITLRVSEGSLVTKAKFTPAENETVDLAADLAIKSLPLSMMTPLMRKAGLADEKFNPRFLWLDCGAAISGPFQGLFQNRPLTLNHCQIEGDGADLRLETASREPGGEWSPFSADIVSLDVSKLLSTIGAQGLESLLAKEGRLQGRLDYRHTDDATVSGTVRNIDFIFSNQNVRALQRIESVELQAKLLKNHLTLGLDQAVLRDGTLDGEMKIELEKPFKSGTLDLAIKKLNLDPAVQDVLVGGHLGDLTGNLKAEFTDARLARLTSFLHLTSTEGKTVRFQQLDIKANQAKENLPHLAFESPVVEIKRDTPIFQGLQPAFMGHAFADDWVAVKKLRGEISVLDEETERALFEWSDLGGSLEASQIQFKSSGRVNRDRKLAGAFAVDFPSVKNLKWRLSGTTTAPVLSGENENVTKFRSRVDGSDAALGLKQK